MNHPVEVFFTRLKGSFPLLKTWPDDDLEDLIDFIQDHGVFVGLGDKEEAAQ
jgi:ADP-heptose:LPS heptosyltransferase